jgi:hypothetical protein
MAHRPPGACWSLIDSEEADILRVAAASDHDPQFVLYANAEAGLAIVDVDDVDNPRLITTSPFTGTPVGVFAKETVAFVVFAPWDRAPETAVRAVDLSPEHVGRTIGEIVLPGSPRDTRRAGDTIVVVHELDDPALQSARRTGIATFALDEGRLIKRDEVWLSGQEAVVGGSPFGIAVAREADPGDGPDRTAVTWLDLPEDGLGRLRVRGTQVVAGVVPRWRSASDHMLDVSEDARVRVIGCATAACREGDPATFAAIDFAEPDRPRVMGSSVIERAGDGVFRFRGEQLVVARRPLDRPSEATELAFFDAGSELVPVGAVRLRGIVASISIIGVAGAAPQDVVTLGWTGSASEGKRAIVHQIDGRVGSIQGIRRGPRLLGSAAFGGDWTWSLAYDDDRAMSFDPGSALGALPMTTVRGDHGAVSAVEILSFGKRGPRAVMDRKLDVVDRLLFHGGRLLAFSGEGVAIVTYPDEHLFRTWDAIQSSRPQMQ